MPIVSRDDSPEIVAILPTMLVDLERVRACVDSLLAGAGEVRLAIVCIVNSSTADATPVRAMGIEVEVAGVNLGWAGGLCLGIALSDSPLVWFVQDDMVVEPSTLAELMAALRADSSLGLAGPIVLNEDGLVEPGSLGGYIDDAGHISEWIPATAVAPSEVDALRAPSYVPSRGMLVTRLALDAIGSPDPRLYPVQFVDVDFCLRLKSGGFGVRLVSTAVTAHGGKGSTGQAFAEFLNTRNAMRIHYKHFAGSEPPGDRFFPVVDSRPDPVDAVLHPLHPALSSELTTAIAQSAADTLTHLARVFTSTQRTTESRIAELEATATDTAAQLTQARREIAEARQQAGLVASELAELQSSASWRVTAPLRWVSEKLRR